jgi:hypothetical protein
VENEPTRTTEFLVLNDQFLDHVPVYIGQSALDAIVVEAAFVLLVSTIGWPDDSASHETHSSRCIRFTGSPIAGGVAQHHFHTGR